MKRTARWCLVIGSFLFLGTLVAREASSARDEGDQPSRWVSKGTGVLSQVVSDKNEWPEVAALKLSSDAYEAFRKNPASFINTHKVFSVNVQDPSLAGVTLIAPQDANVSTTYVVLVHGHTSTTYWASVPPPPSN